MSKEYWAVFASIQILEAGSAKRKSPALTKLTLQWEEADDQLPHSVPLAQSIPGVERRLSSRTIKPHATITPIAKVQLPQTGSKQQSSEPCQQDNGDSTLTH